VRTYADGIQCCDVKLEKLDVSPVLITSSNSLQMKQKAAAIVQFGFVQLGQGGPADSAAG
jgi:hypothetical protein